MKAHGLVVIKTKLSDEQIKKIKKQCEESVKGSYMCLTKERLFDRFVQRKVWPVFQEVYELSTPCPTSDKQKMLMDGIANVLYKNFGKGITREVLQEIAT